MGGLVGLDIIYFYLGLEWQNGAECSDEVKKRPFYMTSKQTQEQRQDARFVIGYRCGGSLMTLYILERVDQSPSQGKKIAEDTGSSSG